MSRIYYNIRVEILVTSKNVNMEEQIIGEINTFCHKLEKLDGSTHIYLHRQDVICEGPEPRTGKGSLD